MDWSELDAQISASLRDDIDNDDDMDMDEDGDLEVYFYYNHGDILDIAYCNMFMISCPFHILSFAYRQRSSSFGNS